MTRGKSGVAVGRWLDARQRFDVEALVMGRRIYHDITIRGQTYATANAAAAALGVQPQTVAKAVQAGRLDGVGLGQSHPVALPVRVRGKTYPTAVAAAKALGLAVSTIYNAIEKGSEDVVGLPRDRKSVV